MLVAIRKKVVPILFMTLILGLFSVYSHAELEKDKSHYYLGVLAKGYPAHMVLNELRVAKARVVSIKGNMILFGIHQKTNFTPVLKNLPFFKEVYSDALDVTGPLKKNPLAQEFLSILSMDRGKNPTRSKYGTVQNTAQTTNRKFDDETFHGLKKGVVTPRGNSRADSTSITTAKTTHLTDATLAGGGTISGRVTDSQGNGIANVYVYIYDTNYNELGNGPTDSNGDYTIQDLTAGSCKVYFDPANAGNYVSEWYNDKSRFNDADLISVTDGQTTRADAILAQGGIISGRVTDSQGNGIGSVYVEIYDMNQNYLGSVSTDSNGDYAIQRLPAGSFKVRFDTQSAGNYLSEWYNDKSSFNNADTISVTVGQTTRVDAILAIGGTINGRVTDLQGNGIENVYAEIYDMNQNHLGYVSTDSNGDYTIQGLLAGSCKIHFNTFNAGNYLSEWYNDKSDFSDADPLAVTAGQTTRADAILAQGGIISGRVIDSQGNGIGSVYVEIYDMNQNYLGSVSTDSNGDYAIQRLPAGSFKVRFDTQSAGNYLSEWYNDKSSFNNADTISVTVGQTTRADAILALGGTISGKVTDSQGNGIENVYALTYDMNLNQLEQAYTDSNGNYTIQGLPAGSCKVYFWPSDAGYYLSEWYNDKLNFENADPVTVTAGQASQVDAILSVGGIVSGRVTDSQGNGIENVHITIYDTNENYLGQGGTDSNGDYTILDLPTGNCKIHFDQSAGNYLPEWYNDKSDFNSADALSITVGQTTRADAILSAGGIVSGRVTDSQGNGIGYVNVQIFDINYHYLKSGSTDSNGDYTIEALPAGSCKVFFYTASNYFSEWYNDKSDSNHADPISVTAGQTTRADAILAEGGMVSGRVTNSQGNGILNVRVSICDMKSIALKEVYTNSNGEYTIRALTAGTRKIVFETMHAGHYLAEWYNDKGNFNSADPISVTIGQTTQADAILSEGGIIGRVTDSQGNGIENVNVTCYDINNKYLWRETTDSNGDYSIENLTDRTCKVFFDASYTGNYLSEWYNDKTDFNSADAISIIVGQTTRVDGMLSRGGIVSGRVTDSQGNGIQSVSVKSYDLNNHLLMSGYTNSNGDYTIQGLTTGSCKIFFDTSNAGNYVSEWYNDKTSFNDADALSVTVGQTTQANAILAGGGIISGRVIDSQGNGINNVYASSYDINKNWLGYDYTNSNGYFQIQGLNTGNCIVYFNTSSANDYASEWYNDKYSFNTANQVPVTKGQTTILNDTVLTMGGRVGGRVTDTSGNAIGRVWVKVYNLDNDYINGEHTDGNGNYTVSGLPAGNFKVQFDVTINYVGEWYNDKNSFSNADPVSVSSQQPTLLTDAQLADGSIISGTVTDGTNGIGNVVMNGLPANPITDSNGNYRAIVDYGWSGTVTPTLAGYAFTAPFTSYTNVTRNLVTNYTGVQTSSPDIQLEGLGRAINNGDTTPAVIDDTEFGNVDVTSGSVTHTFTIRNTGNAILSLTLGPNYVTVSPSTHFNITVQPAVASIPMAGTTTFQVTYNPASIGTHTAIITLNSNDPDETPFTFSIQGTGTSQVNLPSVTTAVISNITKTSAVSGGSVTTDGGSAVTARGVCWSTSPNPTTTNSKTTDGSGLGDFTSTITGLTQNTIYYVRAYATNAQGTSYGSQKSFTATTRSLNITITEPQHKQTVSGTVTIKATANADASISALRKVAFYIDNTLLAELTTEPYETSWNSSTSSDGPHIIKAVAFNQQNQTTSDHVTIFIANTETQLIVNREQLNFGAVPQTAASQQTEMWITGSQTLLISSNHSNTFKWHVTTDAKWLACTPTSGQEAGTVSVTADATKMAAGTYQTTITISSPGASYPPATLPVQLTIYNTGTTIPPYGAFETPLDNATVMGNIAVSGWVLDDIEATDVKIYRAPLTGESGNIYIGDAVFVDDARPEVEEANTTVPKNYRSGWGYMMLTNFLPNQGNGTFTLYAIARDKEGNETNLGSKTIHVDNRSAVKPFGTIDTPDNIGIASGTAYVNYGWALTPQPNTIPTDGSTIQVWVDGLPVGKPVYNQYREDIAMLFPGYNNSNGAIGYFFLNTTQYLDGVHTIAWSVEDDGGNIDGIGSRFFSIQNMGTHAQSKAHFEDYKSFIGGISSSQLKTIPIIDEPVSVRKGYNRRLPYDEHYPDIENLITVNLRESERLEIGLLTEKGSSIAGYLLVGNKLRMLPPGTTLDSLNGIFYWQPGPGFVGEYHFLFIGLDKQGQYTRRNIIVNIIPKHN